MVVWVSLNKNVFFFQIKLIKKANYVKVCVRVNGISFPISFFRLFKNKFQLRIMVLAPYICDWNNFEFSYSLFVCLKKNNR
jgi:hypothetical protein